MRLAVYCIFVYVMLGLQVGVSRYVAYHGAAPNLGLIAVLFIALNAPRSWALLGSFAIGLLQDLLTGQQPGLFALSYGLVAMIVVGAHHLVNRNHPLTHFSLALIGGLLTAMVLLIHSWIHPAAPAVIEGKMILRAIRIPVGVEFTRALYTAAVAPIFLLALGRIRGVFAFRPTRGKGKAW